MNLWIRSQDKKILTPINEKLEIVIGKYVNSTISEYRPKQFYEIYYKDNTLGEYLTKERALEVLDEIQKLLMPQVKVIYNKTEEVKLQDFTSNIIAQPVIEDIQIQQASSYVYEMPKERL